MDTSAPRRSNRYASYDLVVCARCSNTLRPAGEADGRQYCRLTSKYIYVPTRFHPSPASLLDFTTQFDVDPSHITLLNKDMLRLMVRARGCRSRPSRGKDGLGNKGRVLVLEKA